jgi:N-methylhydantoinase A
MRVAIDTGGTFTDCVFVRGGRLEVVKVFSTPSNPAQAIFDALARINSGAAGRWDLICGTTVGTNALLERRGGRVVLLTTAGFEDVIEIGRQARPQLYNFFVERPPALVPAGLRIGVKERSGADGRTLLPLRASEMSRVLKLVGKAQPGAVAVCLLFSYANPAHERALARALRRHGLLVSVSHEILPEFREFERTSTTVINAYLAPVMSRYLGEIETRARSVSSTPFRNRQGNPAPTQVRVMQSSGGIISARAAAREPVRTILSGPAGGVLGAQYAAACSGFSRIVGFDMGGTSTDVALLDGEPAVTNEATVAGLPVAVPILDIHTVGAGGGSIARFDRAGALRVGPESAGAHPGPICYGKGQKPTVTDAHLILGHIPPENFLGGEFRLDETRTRIHFRRALALSGGRIRSVEELAQGILDVANATMEKAIRVISIERGYDPRDYTLVAFGGAGGLHACDLAAALDMPRVLLPKFPGALSALGILRADVVRDFSQTVRRPAHDAAQARRECARAFAALEQRGERELRAEGFSRARIHSARFLDLRYSGQSFELTVPAGGQALRAFHQMHERRYGYADQARPVEIVNVRVRMVGRTPKPALLRGTLRAASAKRALRGTRRAAFAGRAHAAPVFDRNLLRAGNRFAGPAIIVEYSATTLLPPGWRARVDAVENIILERAR